jgi:hypothetical protein
MQLRSTPHHFKFFDCAAYKMKFLFDLVFWILFVADDVEFSRDEP